MTLSAIKFRAWNPDTKVMTYIPNGEGSYIRFGATGFIKPLEWYVSDKGESCAYSDRSKLMQFTGLYDKNRKEIYEGDCLRSVEDKEVYQVGNLIPMSRMAIYDYSTNVGYFDEKNKYHTRSSGDAYHKDDWISSPEFYEVIGNVWENPKLLTN